MEVQLSICTRYVVYFVLPSLTGAKISVSRPCGTTGRWLTLNIKWDGCYFEGGNLNICEPMTLALSSQHGFPSQALFPESMPMFAQHSWKWLPGQMLWLQSMVFVCNSFRLFSWANSHLVALGDLQRQI